MQRWLLVSLSVSVLLVISLFEWRLLYSTNIGDPKALAFVAWLLFPALLEMDARQQFMDRYRRCDPDPWDSRVLNQVRQIGTFHVREFLDIEARNLAVGRQLISDDTVRALVSTFTSPFITAVRFGVDLLALCLGLETFYAPAYSEPICHVYCDFYNDMVCQYI